MEILKSLLKYKNIIGLTKELKGKYLFETFLNHNKNVLLVANTLYEANLYYQIISNYTDEVLLFPMDDFLTSEALAISPELKVKRIETMLSIIESNKKIVITNLMGYLRYLPLKNQIKDSHVVLEMKKELNPKVLINKLINIGYEKTTIVNKTGDFAVRGFVIDIFPLNSDNPLRIEFFGDEIEELKYFNIDTQISYEKVEKIIIPINTEFIVDESIDLFNLKYREINKYINPENIISYLNKPIVFYDDYKILENNYQLLEEEMFNYSLSINIDSDTKYMHNFYDLFYDNCYNFSEFVNLIEPINSLIDYKAKELLPFSPKKEDINNRLNIYLKANKKVIIYLDNSYKINKLIDFLENDKLLITNNNSINPNYINVIKNQITFGYEIDDYVVISENDLNNKKNVNNRYHTKFKLGTKIRDLRKLDIGDYVVHVVHGIGKYLGIKAITKNGLKKDYLQLQYKDNDKVYVPVEKIELLSKYASNNGFEPKLTKLGSIEWEKTKLRVKQKIESIAEDLLKLYAEREAIKGFSFTEDNDIQLEFENSFEYIPTSDQLKVIDEIKKDMEKSHPMDRLLCGDVGFGKTEVAFRAVFKAVLSGKQVAFLCPTTILSSQHYNNALERFKNYPINIALLNRFVTVKETNNILKRLKEGKIDIIIGTHKLLNEKVVFKDLGLLVIDEEQRFGVTHKEKIKQYKNNIDVLTLTATPIPRTLQMSMAGVRSLSLIETPPINRYPIQTYVLEENSQMIKDAIYKELSRNGQVFILYNHIDGIISKASEIRQLIPEARITYAHGKMDKTAIEDVMINFINKEFDILICTTIIETGIDIPNVNTLIILEADHFGLSQLYQIRGRVGRSDKIAYCYLMYNKHKILSEIAIKRLKVIKDFTELGSGFSIAMRDLSLRGAGDILGKEQAGFVDSVGIELFLNMLNNEIALKKGEMKEEVLLEQPLIEVSTSIDDNYVSDEELKIEIHNKINIINSKEDLETIKFELENRFGKLSEDLIIYMYEELFENEAKKLNITKINQTKNFIEVTLHKELVQIIDGQLLFIELSRLSRMFRFSMKKENLIITLDIIKLEKHFIYYLIDFIDILKKAFKA